MNLTTEVKDEQPVVISVNQTEDGDVDILANGLKIAFIDSSTGTVVFYAYASDSSELKELGFQINDNDEVAHD